MNVEENDFHQVTARLCKDAAEILLQGAGGDQTSILYKVGKSQKRCQAALFSEYVYFSKTAQQKTRLLGVNYCKRRSCPYCVIALAASQRQRVAEVCRLWKERSRNNSFLFMTFTIPHSERSIRGNKSMDATKAYLAECDLLLEMTWRTFSKTYRETLVGELGLVSQLRRSEVPFGGTDDKTRSKIKWHPHIHCLAATNKNHKLQREKGEPYRIFSQRQAKENLRLSNILFEAWSKSMNAVLRKSPDRFPSIEQRKKRGQTVLKKPFIVEFEKTSMNKSGRQKKMTVSGIKGGVTCEAPYGNNTDAIVKYLASELTMSHSKAGKISSSFSWRGALEHFPKSAWTKLLYRHWVKSTFRKSTLEWGRVSVRRGGHNKWISFEKYIVGKKSKRKSTMSDREIIGAMPVPRFARLAENGELAIALDKADASDNGLDALELEKELGKKKLYKKERALLIAQQIGGHLKRGSYCHKTVRKRIPLELLLLICQIDITNSQIAELMSGVDDRAVSNESRFLLLGLFDTINTARGQIADSTQKWLKSLKRKLAQSRKKLGGKPPVDNGHI